MAFNAGAIYGTAKLNTGPWKSGLASLQKTAKIAGAAIAATFVGTMAVSIKKANEYQKALSNVSTMLDTNQVSMVKMSKAILQLNPNLGDTVDLTKGLYQAYSAGAKDMDEAMKITENAAMFAKAALTDTATAVDVLTTAVNAYGREQMDTTKASDLFFTTIKQGKITGEQLAGSIGQSIPLFASAGIELEELSAGIAAMTKQGVDAANATTQLNGIVNSFLKPQEALNNLIREYGYESGAALLKSEGLVGALRLVEDATDGDAAAMAELLPNIRALRGAMALTGVGGEELNSILGEMSNSANATAEAFEKQEKTFETFKNSAGQVLTIVGNIGKAFVDQVLVGLTDSTQKMKEFLLSEEAMFRFAQIAGFVGASFTVIKEAAIILWETLKSALQPTIDVMKETFSELFGAMNNEGVNASTILTGAMKTLGIAIAIPVNVVSTLVNLIITLVKSAKLGAESVGNFFKVMKREMSFKEFQAEAIGVQAEVGELWKDFGKDTSDIWSGVIGEVKNFGDSVRKDSEDMVANVKVSYNNASNFVLKNWDEWITGAKKGNADLVDDTEESAKEIEDVSKEQTETQKEETEKRIELVGNGMVLQLQGYEAGLEKHIEMQEQKWEEDRQKFEDHWQKKYEIVNQYTSQIGNVISFGVDTFSAITSQYYENEKAIIDNAYQAELDALDAKVEAGTITEEEYNDRRTKLDDKYNQKKNELAKKQFETQKALDIANVWMNAASSIMGWWATAWQLGPIAGPIFAGIMSGVVTGAAIAQHALIAKQQFVPKKAEGGRVSGGDVMVNEEGPEIVRLPGGSLVIPNQLSEQIAGGGGGFSGTINIYEPRVRNDEDIDLLVDRIATRLGSEMRIA